MSVYYLGNRVRATALFRDNISSTNLVDPNIVKCNVKNPIDTLNQYIYGVSTELIRPSTGTYYIDIDLDKVGLWNIRFFSENTYVSSEEITIYCNTHNAAT